MLTLLLQNGFALWVPNSSQKPSANLLSKEEKWNSFSPCTKFFSSPLKSFPAGTLTDGCRGKSNKQNLYCALCFFLFHLGLSPVGRGASPACPHWQPRRPGDGGSAGGEAQREVASRLQPRLGPQQQPRRLRSAGIPICRGL